MWDPVSDSNLQGYKIHYGKASGFYDQVQDIGDVTSYTLQNFLECTRYYIVVTWYDTSGNESRYSYEVNGLPKPQISSISPFAAEQGRTLTITIDGCNYENGTTVRTGNPGITVISTSYLSCTQLKSTFSIAETAGTGLCDIEVINADGIYGIAPLSFEVTPSIPPEVTSTTPSDGSKDIPVIIHPEVAFSEAIDQTTVSSSTILLLDEGSNAVPQASGSPSLNSSATVATIIPFNNLSYSSVYKIKVIGGVNGIKDLAGHPMDSDFVQDTGFTTVADKIPPVIFNISSSDIASTSADITWRTDELADSMVE